MIRNSEPSNSKQEHSAVAAMEKLGRQLRMTQILCGVLCLLLLCMLAAGVVAYSRMEGYMKQVQPLVEQLSALDYAALEDTMQGLAASLNGVNWEQLSQQISALDMETLNAAMEGLDTQELTKALENLNGAVQTLENLSGKLQKFFERFSF